MPAGNWFYIFDVKLQWATGIWHSNSGQRDVYWRDPLDHFSSQHHSGRLPWCFTLISHQVSYSEGFTQACIWPLLWVYTKQHEQLTKELLRETTVALLVCVCGLCEILTLRCHCNERQLNISLIISGMISCQWAVPGVVKSSQSPECDNIWDDNSFTPSFTPPVVPYVAAV